MVPEGVPPCVPLSDLKSDTLIADVAASLWCYDSVLRESTMLTRARSSP